MKSKFPMYCNAPLGLIERASELRKSMTIAEKALWFELKNQKLGVKFRRQHPCDNFILDFFCYEKRLAIEVDGEYHLSKEQFEYDIFRTTEIEKYDIHLIRFTNQEVLLQTRQVVEEIKNQLTFNSRQ